MGARTQNLRARCALAAAALSVAIAALVPAAAFAGGPGVTVIGRQLATPFTLSGDQLTAGADVPATSYTVRQRPGTATKVTRSGMSMRSLLQRAGINVGAITRVAVSRRDGSDLVLTRADLASPSPFPEGPPVVSDLGGTTRLLRPVRNAKDSNGRDDVDSGGGPLLIRVDDATSLAVTAEASPTSVRTGKDVTFTARVQSAPPGLTYHWDFGDGATAEGAKVTHSFDAALDQQVQVTVTGSCASFCQGLDSVTVIVGNPRKGPNAPGATNPGSGTGNPLSAGTGTGNGAGGPGGSGGGDVAGATGQASVDAVVAELARQRAADRAKEKARRDAARKAILDAAARRKAAREAKLAAARRKREAAAFAAAGGRLVTGILLDGQGAPLPGGLPALPATPAGAPKGPQAARGTSIADAPSVPGSVAVGLLVIAAGALRERRLVRLRTA